MADHSPAILQKRLRIREDDRKLNPKDARGVDKSKLKKVLERESTGVMKMGDNSAIFRNRTEGENTK